MNDDIRKAASTLWSFHCVYDELKSADVIIGLGSYDTRVALWCAELFHLGLAPRIIFTGASGNWTRDLFPGSEADAFSECAQQSGVPPEAIILEPTATNLSENIRFCHQIAPNTKRAIFVSKPQTQLRCQAAGHKQWPDVHAMALSHQTTLS